MIFCEKCFVDKEVISIIESVGVKGQCPICNHKNVYIYDTDKNDELSTLFDDFLSIYTPTSKVIEEKYPKSETRMIKSELLNSWNIFNKISESDVYNIITAICYDKYQYSSELFDQAVIIEELYDKNYLSQNSLLGTNTWSDFCETLKSKNRFHTHCINLKLLEMFFSYIRKVYKKGAIFYRCRISSEDGVDKGDMGAPESKYSRDGRANAKGISCLYLGDSVKTTICEVRAGAFDYVTVGKFRLKEDIVVVDLKQINQISPFIGLDCKVHAVNKEFLSKINSEMSKVMRKNDSILEYLPTQYITDFIKSIEYSGKSEYAGIEYKSVMNDRGYNLAIFDQEVFECIDTTVYRINNIDYDSEII